MNDLFQNTCPCCGQPMPDKVMQSSSFETFWQDVPHKVGKEAARKAWGKLSTPDRIAAHERIAGWYRWFADKHPQASLPHPASYLNGKRWQDEVASNQASVPRAHRLSSAAESIKSGRRYLCTQIPASIARECVSQGLVTEDQCREVGVI